MSDLATTLDAHKAALLGRPGCTAVAIGKKVVGGSTTDVDCIVVFVAKKQTVAPPHHVPAEIAGIPTDVVERTFSFKATTADAAAPDATPDQVLSTDPFARFDPLICGISVTSWNSPKEWGSIGCFVTVNGNASVAAGTYMLTNQHVIVESKDPDEDQRVIQPGKLASAPTAASAMGSYIYALRDPSHDCGVVSIVGRTYANDVPNYPWYPGRRSLKGIAAAQVGDRVYKYGATTKWTEGVVKYLNFADDPYTDAIYIEAEDGKVWVNSGDSGSVLIRYADDVVLGLNFTADTDTPVSGGYNAGLAYDMAAQLQVFGGGRLA